MVRLLDEYKQSFWGVVEVLAQEKPYKVVWEDGEMAIYPAWDKKWRVVVFDEPRNAFLHFEVRYGDAVTMTREGYYLPGLSPAIAEQMIFNYLREAEGMQQKGLPPAREVTSSVLN